MADPPVAARFDELAAGLPATIGIAIATPGRTEPYSLGQWSSGVAWSTIKVPLAIAALRHDRPQARNLVVKAITKSDNRASEQLWSQLGDPTDAARRVQAVVDECGDADTVVESRRLRRGYTAFGQTRWTLDRQARFAARLPHIADAATVLDLMSHLTSAHRWGLAAKGVAAKGGWGPGARGDYLVRQFGVPPTGSGHVGVALAAEARSFKAGVDALNAMADWLVDHLSALTEQ